MRSLPIVLIAFVANATAAGAATLTYSAIREELRTLTEAVGSQGGGVIDVDGQTQSLLFFGSAVGASSADLDFQTGMSALADAAATQSTVLQPDSFFSLGTVGYSLSVSQGGLARGEAESNLEFTFVSDQDVDIEFSATVSCLFTSCDASVQLLGPLGTGALLDLITTQNGSVSSSVTARILAGQRHTVIARTARLAGIIGTGSEDGGGSFQIGMVFIGVPEPRITSLFGAALLALAARGRWRTGGLTRAA